MKCKYCGAHEDFIEWLLSGRKCTWCWHHFENQKNLNQLNKSAEYWGSH